MAKCFKCKCNLDDNFLYCPYCGKKITVTKQAKRRGNGTGSVYKLNDKWIACITVYKDGKRTTKSKQYRTKSEAMCGLLDLKQTPVQPSQATPFTLKQIYDMWLPGHSDRVSRDTINCYTAAFRYFKPIHNDIMYNISIDDLQECVDNCQLGKRTKQNMKAVVGLLYKYAISRKYIENTNLAQFIYLDRIPENKTRISFSEQQIESIKNCIGKIYGAEYIYCLIYLGFRPSEYLALTKDRYYGDYIIGGAKTKAGTDRTVTISPKIMKYLENIVNDSSEYIIHKKNGNGYSLKEFTEQVFYPVLECADIDNPINDGRHLFTPHSCRHTFATLMKKIKAPSKDKESLIGHSSEEMLKYYQDCDLDDMKRITDNL